jgi:hypothetical protein
MNYVILYMMHKVTHNIGGVMGLQNCMDVLKSEPGPCTGTCQISPDDGNEVSGKRGEEVTCIKVEEDPWPATSTGIETERAVSCVYVCVYPLLFTWHRYPEFPVRQCVSVCIKL